MLKIHSAVKFNIMTEMKQRLNGFTETPDLLCFSHLRWDFVFQRPQHLMTRFATERRVFYIEEPVTAERPEMRYKICDSGVWVLTPHIPEMSFDEQTATLRELLTQFLQQHRVQCYWAWYYTPMALPWTGHLDAIGVVYDCMDELSAFKNAPPALRNYEIALMKRADLVFTGGHSLFEAKRHLHPRVYPFPSSIDLSHFARARRMDDCDVPADEATIPRPRLGYCGVIDERMDLELVQAVADAQPHWHWVMVGPVVKILPSELPVRPNIHYLGMKKYEELPAYIGGWDVAVLPFARNEATKFISPTKTPEYLAAGRPVVSTSIRDVISPYGDLGLVQIADQPDEFISAIQTALVEPDNVRIRAVDAVLSQNSWSRTWIRMKELMDDKAARPSSLVASQSLQAPFPASIPGRL